VSARAMSASGVQCSGVRVSNVRVWTSGVPRRCPRVPRRCPQCPHRVTSWSASARRAATRPGGPGSGRPALSANGSGSCPSPSRGAEPARAVLDQQRRRAGPGRRRGRRSDSGPGSTAWPARDTPVGRQDRPSVEGQRPRAGTPRRHGSAGRQGQDCRHQPIMTWAEPVATTIGARCDGPGPRVARSGRSSGSIARGPGAAQASSERHRPGGGSALSWENSGGPART